MLASCLDSLISGQLDRGGAHPLLDAGEFKGALEVMVNRSFFHGPVGPDEDVLWGDTEEAHNNDVLPEPCDGLTEQLAVFFEAQERKRFAAVELGVCGALDDVEMVKLDAVDWEGRDPLDGLEHLLPGFAGEAVDNVASDPELWNRSDPSHGALEAGEIVASVEGGEGCIVAALEANLDPNKGPLGELGEELDDRRLKAIGPGADGEPDDLIEAQSGLVDAPQVVEGAICIGEILKVDDEFLGAVAAAYGGHPRANLLGDALASVDGDGAKAGIVAVCTAASRNAAVDVRAGEAGVHADLVDLGSEELPQVGSIAAIAQGRLQGADWRANSASSEGFGSKIQAHRMDVKKSALPGHLALVHEFLRALLQPGDLAVDATCGNGHDTLLLAKAVGDAGRVIGFDLQEAALKATRERRQAARVWDRVSLRLESHARLAAALERAPAAVVFNLGYLPGSDHHLKTRPEETLLALDGAAGCLAAEGGLAVTCYRGHEGGAEETRAVREWFAALDPEHWQTAERSPPNRPLSPVALFAQRQIVRR